MPHIARNNRANWRMTLLKIYISLKLVSIKNGRKEKNTNKNSMFCANIRRKREEEREIQTKNKNLILTLNFA